MTPGYDYVSQRPHRDDERPITDLTIHQLFTTPSTQMNHSMVTSLYFVNFGKGSTPGNLLNPLLLHLYIAWSTLFQHACHHVFVGHFLLLFLLLFWFGYSCFNVGSDGGGGGGCLINDRGGGGNDGGCCSSCCYGGDGSR